MPNRRLYTATEVQTLSAGWMNQDGSATIYLSTDPGVNQATLALSNHTSGPVRIPAGTPVAYERAGEGGQGTLYLFFNGLLTGAQVDEITVDAPGWSTASYTDESTGLAYLAFAPAAAVTLGVSETLALPLRGVTASGSARMGNLTLALEGVTGLPLGAAVQWIFVNVAAGSGAGNRKLELLTEFAGPDFVFTGSEENELLLVLTNPGAEPIVPEGTEAWEETPTFTFSFVFAPSGGSARGALLSEDDAPGLSVALAGEYGNVWKPVLAATDGRFPVWVAQPDPNGGGTVLGTGANASVSFRISGLVTRQPPGVTYLYIAYSNVPGYDDGYFALEIVKVAPATATLSASTGSVPMINGETQVSLSWRVENATYATITNTTMAQRVHGTASGTTPASVAATTAFTLLASNHFTGQTVAATATVTVPTMPRGTIVMWSGSTNGVPAGWHLCDGSNGTPNLTNRFIRGAGTSGPAVGSTGGADTHMHIGHLSVQIQAAGDHVHGMPEGWYANSAGSGSHVKIVDRHDGDVTNQTTQRAGNHTHQASGSVSIDQANHTPPYYALAFIMKL